MNFEIFIFGILILLFDIPFITFIMKPKYQNIGLAKNTKIIFALCAYLIMISSWFLIEGDLIKAALAGFVIYGIYGFTLAAILPEYTLSMGLTELIWGTLLYVLATFLTKKIKIKLKNVLN